MVPISTESAVLWAPGPESWVVPPEEGTASQGQAAKFPEVPTLSPAAVKASRGQVSEARASVLPEAEDPRARALPPSLKASCASILCFVLRVVLSFMLPKCQMAGPEKRNEEAQIESVVRQVPHA